MRPKLSKELRETLFEGGINTISPITMRHGEYFMRYNEIKFDGKEFAFYWQGKQIFSFETGYFHPGDTVTVTGIEGEHHFKVVDDLI